MHSQKLISISLFVFCSLWPTAVAVAQQPREDREIRLRREMEKEFARVQRLRIDFYGRVVDQFGVGVPGAEVSIKTFSLNDPSGPQDAEIQKVNEFVVRTDDTGAFGVMDKRGNGLAINGIKKEGYVDESKAPSSFNYDPEESVPVHRSDPFKPVVYRVWKSQGKVQLVSWDSTRMEIPQDGEPFVFDMLRGQKFKDGQTIADLRISVRADFPTIKTQPLRYPWKVRIEVIDGGLIQTNDDYMYLAPESGYERAWETTVDPQQPDWSNMKTFHFYVHNWRGQHYARVELRLGVSSQTPQGTMEIKYALNPFGSRILEGGGLAPGNFQRR